MKSQLEKLQREIVESNSQKKEKERRLTEAKRRLEQMQRVMAAGIQEKSDMEAELIRMRYFFQEQFYKNYREIRILYRSHYKL